MKTKHIFLSILVLLLSLVLGGCENIENFPQALEIEEDINKIIKSKEVGYNFLEDELYTDRIGQLVELFVGNKIIEARHHAIGDLDQDNIPELVVFRKRNIEDKYDDGRLEVYKFNGDKYTLLDSVSMNYDNDNQQISLGKISPEQNGIYVNNQVGSHSSITYGFILRDNKLTSILNPKKLNLVSPYPYNEITDKNKDGILRFSIVISDPEVEGPFDPDQDKIKLWYQWDGNDSGILLEAERIGGKVEKQDTMSNEYVLVKARNLLEAQNYPLYLDYIYKHKDKLSRIDTSNLLKEYLLTLEKNKNRKNLAINSLSSSSLDGRHRMDLDKLNDLEFLNREETLKLETDLKYKLIENLNLGYKLKKSSNSFEYTVDYQRFINDFHKHILNEFRDYLKILDLDFKDLYSSDGDPLISLDQLAGRIVLLENFKMTYPYSNYMDIVNKLYREYTQYLFSYRMDRNLSKHDLEKLESIIEKYSHSYLSDLISKQLDKYNDKLPDNNTNSHRLKINTILE